MRDGGRLAAAAAVLNDIFTRHKPVRTALKDWGSSARYAGAKDRAFVSGLVLDALRRRNSLTAAAGDEADLVLAAARFVWGWDVDRLKGAVNDPHGPAAPGDWSRYAGKAPVGETPWVRGDYPEWLDESFARVFGEARAAEGAALASRAPTDLRVNRTKTDREAAMAVLAPFGPVALAAHPDAIRIPAPDADQRQHPVEALPQFEMGWFEVQDLGSQLAAAAAEVKAGERVLDLCAGGGGKALAMAAAAPEAEIIAFDADARRLTDTQRRAIRAGATNITVRTPLHGDVLKDLEGSMDLVFIDAPCTGTGTWRRHPDAKWRLTPKALAQRQKEQDTVLETAARYLKPTGRIVYVTCSVLAEEDEDRVADFLARRPDFRLVDERRMTPLSDGCDGFFVARLARTA
jgi:16S rRNA (cytosine967-C5)-methyltransferase